MGRSNGCIYKIGDKEYEVYCDEVGEYHVSAENGDGKQVYDLGTEKKALKFILSAFKADGSRRREKKVDLNSLTWEKIAEYSESGKAAQIFEIGDTKDFTLTTGEKCKAVILDFDHDTLAADATKKAGITFGLLNCLEGAYVMNNEWTNEGGYIGSKMFTTINTVFYDKLPEDMKPFLKRTVKTVATSGEDSEIKEFDAFVFLLSEVEAFGTTYGSYEGEGTQYPYYEKEENRIKKLGENGTACTWWLRSPRSTYSAYFCSVTSDGTLSNYLAGLARGLSAGFCI